MAAAPSLAWLRVYCHPLRVAGAPSALALVSRRECLTCRKDLFSNRKVCVRAPVEGTALFRVNRVAQALRQVLRSTRRIGSDINDVRLETIGRILSILSILLRQRRSGARRLNTMLGADRQAQRAEKLFGGSVWRSWSLWRSSFFKRRASCGGRLRPTHPSWFAGRAAGWSTRGNGRRRPSTASLRHAEGDPAVDGECTGQVGDCCLGSDDQVQEAHHGGCVEKIAAQASSPAIG